MLAPTVAGQLYTLALEHDITIELGTTGAVQVDFLYRDANNYRQHDSVIVRGDLSEEQALRLLLCLDDGVHFIPAQVGLASLQASWGEVDEACDHVWHELAGLTPSSKPAGSGSVLGLLDAFEAAARDGWDVVAAHEALFGPDA